MHSSQKAAFIDFYSVVHRYSRRHVLASPRVSRRVFISFRPRRLCSSPSQEGRLFSPQNQSGSSHEFRSVSETDHFQGLQTRSRGSGLSPPPSIVKGKMVVKKGASNPRRGRDFHVLLAIGNINIAGRTYLHPPGQRS